MCLSAPFGSTGSDAGIVVEAADVDLLGTIVAGANRVVFDTSLAANPTMRVGGTGLAGELHLSTTELTRISQTTAALLRFGGKNTRFLIVDALTYSGTLPSILWFSVC